MNSTKTTKKNPLKGLLEKTKTLGSGKNANEQKSAIKSNILNEIYEFTGRYVSYPSEHAHIAHVLWIAHTHLMEFWFCTPRLAVLSPERECGKTRLLEVTSTLVPNPTLAVNVSPSFLFRSVANQENLPTILHDEVDIVFSSKSGNYDELRGLLNAGFSKGAVTGRTVKKNDKFIPEYFPSYCAVALAGIGIHTLPDTLLSRSIILLMRRRKKNEKVESWRTGRSCVEGQQLREQLESWAKSIHSLLSGDYPNLPDGVEDRAADMWEPLIMIAEAAGCGWPEKSRSACVAFVTESKRTVENLGIRLLRDLRTVFGPRERMLTADILGSLSKLEESPWCEYQGNTISAYKLSRLLKPYGVKPRDLRSGNKRGKGYFRDELFDAWERYLTTDSD